MSVAYVDTSALVAIAFAEDGAEALADRLGGFSRLVSSVLLEAELASACAREGCPVPGALLARIGSILTERPLSPEIRRVLAAGTVRDDGTLRGAELWHLAAALYVAPEPAAISFITLNEDQARIARALNFQG